MGGIGAIVGSGITAAANAALQEDSQAFAKKMYRHRYRYTMSDMRKAGLNPMLAYSQGVGNPGSAGMASVPDFGQSLVAGTESTSKKKSRVSERELLKQQTQNAAKTGGNIDADTKLKESQAAGVNATTAKDRAFQPLWDTLGGGFDSIKSWLSGQTGIDHLRPVNPSQDNSARELHGLMQRLAPHEGSQRRNKQGKSDD